MQNFVLNKLNSIASLPIDTKLCQTEAKGDFKKIQINAENTGKTKGVEYILRKLFKLSLFTSIISTKCVLGSKKANR